MRRNILALSLLLGLCDPVFAADHAERWKQVTADRDSYRESLDRVRKAHGGEYKLPAVDFFLFGMGNRDKFVWLM